MTRAFHEEWERERSSARRRRTAARDGRALGRDIPCRVAPQQSSTPFHPAPVILLDDGEFGIPGGIIREHGVDTSSATGRFQPREVYKATARLRAN